MASRRAGVRGLPVVPRRVRAARARTLNDQATRDAIAHERSPRGEPNAVELGRVRAAVGLTQTDIAKTLRMTQPEVSKLERRTNPQLATLTRYIHATGGELEICAVYGDIKVRLALGDLERPPTTVSRRAPSPRPRSASDRR
jgi:DNA-binding phage protein